MDQTTACGCLVLYAGCVQGVGFRATAVTIAQQYPVAGYVRNLPDGRVELFAQGERDQVEAFLANVRGYWGNAIWEELADWRAATGKYSNFRVTR